MGLRVWDTKDITSLGVQGLGFRVQGGLFRVQGLGFRCRLSRTHNRHPRLLNIRF